MIKPRKGKPSVFCLNRGMQIDRSLDQGDPLAECRGPQMTAAVGNPIYMPQHLKVACNIGMDRQLQKLALTSASTWPSAGPQKAMIVDISYFHRIPIF